MDGKSPDSLNSLSTPFSRTDLSQNDKTWRLIHKIQSRVNYFKEQVDYRQTSPEHSRYLLILQGFEFKANLLISNILNHGNYFHYNKTMGDSRIRLLRKWIQERDRLYEEAYDWCKNWPKQREHLTEVFDIEIEESYREATQWHFLLKLLEDTSYETTVACMKSRLMLQIYESYEEKWYISFGTLTVDPEHYQQVFETGSTCWRNYIREIQRRTFTAAFADKDLYQGQDYFHYAAVVEEGSQNGRLHIHCIFFMLKPIPAHDPNFGLQIPYKREIDDWRMIWKYGMSQYIAVRFSNSDTWGQMGWSWPVHKDGQPIEPTNPDKLSNYLVKYILKAKTNTKGDIAPWRTRTNRRMGKVTLMKTLSSLTESNLLALTLMNKYPRKILLFGNPVPTKFIRKLAVSELISRWRENRKNLEALPKDTTLKTLLRSSTLKKHVHRSMNSGSIITQLLSGRDISDEQIHLDFIEARKCLKRAFPKPLVNQPVSGGSTQ